MPSSLTFCCSAIFTSPYIFVAVEAAGHMVLMDHAATSGKEDTKMFILH